MIRIIIRNNNNYLFSYASILNKLITNSNIFISNNSLKDDKKYNINLYIEDILEDTFELLNDDNIINVLLISNNNYKDEYLVRYTFKNKNLIKLKDCIDYVFYKFNFMENYLKNTYKNILKIPILITDNINKNNYITNNNIIYLNINNFNFFDNSKIIDCWIKNNYFNNIKPKPKLIVYCHSYKIILSNIIKNIKSHKNIEIIHRFDNKKINYDCSIITTDNYDLDYEITNNIVNKKYIITLKRNITDEIFNNYIILNENNIKECFTQFFNLNINDRIKQIKENNLLIENNNNQFKTLFNDFKKKFL
jgi:hypothetical protein